jgi:O-antigen/teichoic acid export membrane protein
VAKLKSNIIFNFLGSGWQAALTLAVTPIQVQILGIEAFGLIGLITVLQVLLSSLDFGISATITKIISSDHSEDKLQTADAINTASTVYWVVATLIALLLFFNSGGIAQLWLTNTKIDSEIITFSIEVIAIYLGLRWPIAFYSGVINGLQRMEVLNLLKAGAHTLRLVGGVIVLFFLPNLLAFLAWFAICAALELIAFLVTAHKLMPTLQVFPLFKIRSFKNIWKYSLSMNLMALTAILLSQADRVVISKLLSLEALGLYSIAYSTSIVISLIQTAINNAAFPSFSSSHSGSRYDQLLSNYRNTSQLMGACVALPTFMLIFFGKEIFEIWINAKVADETASIMIWLSLGFYFNALVSTTYILLTACGKPNIPLKINLLAIAIYLPALVLMVPRHGAVSAAVAYMALNIYYILTLTPAVRTILANQTMRHWLSSSLVPFLTVGILIFGGLKLALMSIWPNFSIPAMLVICISTYFFLSWFLLSPSLRESFQSLAEFRKK